MKSKVSVKGLKKNLLICLYGGGDTGKTSTLLELGAVLRSKSKVYTEIKGNSGSTDMRMVFDVFGDKIGIGTYGDGLGYVDKNIETLRKYKRTIIITASREPIDRLKVSLKPYTNIISFLKNAAIWNMAKNWEEDRNGKKVVNVTGIGELLYYIKKAVSLTRGFADEDVI